MRGSITFYLDAARIALQAIFTHKLRTFLTLIGIIIGVASVVLVGAALDGMNAYVLRRVSELLGVNNFVIAKVAYAGKITQEELDEMNRRNKEIKWSDFEWLSRHCSSCTEVGATDEARVDLRHDGLELLGVRVNGVTANMRVIWDKKIVEGRFIDPHEVEQAALVCVIGMDVREKFFRDRNPIGKTLKIHDMPLQIVGVEEKHGTFLGGTMDNYVYVPLTTFGRIFSRRRSLQLHAKAASLEELEWTIEDARVAMRNRRKLMGNEQDNFAVADIGQVNTQVDQFTNTVALVATPITLISLLVGGIVVMNIMLVGVSERTFEIGLRKAVGARPRHILLQFLIESALLSSVGGVAGLLIAAAVSWVMNLVTTIPMKLTPTYLLLALFVSGGIGLIFGVYPAYKAARLDPIVALTRD